MTKILIVDDEPFTVDMLQTFLQMNGFETCGAFCGEDGVTLVQVEQPNLLIVDLMMPDIEGFEVCSRVRRIPEYAALPIIIISARADALARQRAADVGANAYLEKPIRFPVLLSELQRLLPSATTQQA